MKRTYTWTPQQAARFRNDPLWASGQRRGRSLKEVLSLCDVDMSYTMPFDQINLKEYVRRALECLTPREEYAIRNYFGIDTDAQTFAELAEGWGIHTSYAREIVLKGLKKLRHPARGKQLRDFVRA